MAGDGGNVNTLPDLLAAGATLAQQVAGMLIPALRRLLLDLATEVQVTTDQVLVTMAANALTVRLGCAASHDGERRCAIVVAAALIRCGQKLRLAFAPADQAAPTQIDIRLVGLLAKAHAAQRTLLAARR